MTLGARVLEAAGSPLLRLARAVVALVHRRRTRPVEYVRWLPLQWEFLASHAKFKQIRAGNQGIGKTWAALAEVIGRCIGRHPLGADGPPIATPPIEAWIVCASWSQSLGIQKKLYELLPKDLLDDRTEYDSAAGFTPTKSPVVRFRNGSIIRIKTTGQDALDFAGATIDVILFDEPPRQSRILVEAMMRLEERGGVLLLSYTPINADVAYLQELCELGTIEDHHSRLTPESLIPVGFTEPLRTKDGRPKDAAWIAAKERKVPACERETVVHGEWPAGGEGAWFGDTWDPETMVFEAELADGVTYTLGIDHGTAPGKQGAWLLAVDETVEPVDLHVLDEYCDTRGRNGPDEDAAAILAMLERNGLEWTDLRWVGGDRVHLPKSEARKSNRDLQRFIARRLQLPYPSLVPEVSTVKRGEGHGGGSVQVGSRFLFHLMARGRFTVNPRCTRLIKAIPRYSRQHVQGGNRVKDEDAKDPLDGCRYGADPWIFTRHARDARA